MTTTPGAGAAPSSRPAAAGRAGAPAKAQRGGKPGAGLPWQYRAAVVLRTVAAGLGGYFCAGGTAAALALALPRLGLATRVDAVMTGTMLGFIAYAVLAMWVFAQAGTRRALAGAVLVAALPWGVAWALAPAASGERPTADAAAADAAAARGGRP